MEWQKQLNECLVNFSKTSQITNNTQQFCEENDIKCGQEGKKTISNSEEFPLIKTMTHFENNLLKISKSLTTNLNDLNMDFTITKMIPEFKSQSDIRRNKYRKYKLSPKMTK